ncbi:MAG: response regulator [Verrucomicrobiales bacterium]|nr:response regulator [Verrucomicrobiales bacterium]
MRILVVEDEAKVAALIDEGLREENFSVDIARDGEEGLYRAKNFPYDLIILDVLLPCLDGFALLEALRKVDKTTRVLLLTARDEVTDRVRGLELGADDYLGKPFAFEELLARVRALLRRSRETQSEILSLADLRLDPRQRRVQRAEREIVLTPKEFAVLEYLLRHPNEVISRTELVEHVWDENFESFSNVIDVTLHHLREKVDRDYPTKLIHTVRGVGYVAKPEG